MPPRPIAGRVVAITGAARGIGRATAAALVAEGARVAIGDLDAELAARTAAELGCASHPLDVTSPESFERFLDWVEAEVCWSTTPASSTWGRSWRRARPPPAARSR